MQVTFIPNVISAFGTVIKGTGKLGGWTMGGDQPKYSITENGQNTEKSPGDFRRLAVIQTPVKEHQLSLMWKIIKSK